MRRLLTGVLLTGAMAGCGRGDFAVQVRVQAPPTSASVCTRVSATQGSETLETDATDLAAGGEVTVLVALDSADAVSVHASGYDNANCTGTPVEQSARLSATPTKTAFPLVTLVLEPVSIDTDGGTDAGSDAGTDDAGADAGTDDAGFDGGFDGGADDAGTDDAGFDAGFDAGTPDAGTPDAGTPDAGTPDAGTPDAGPECTPSTIGQSCAAATGTCNFEGACITNFPYQPSNFDEADLPATDGGVVFTISSSTTLNADAGVMVPSFAMPPFRFIASDAGYARVLLIHVDELNVTSTLNLVGDIPVIIAVSRNATISGGIFARSGANTPTCGSGAGQAGPGGGAGFSGGAGGGGFGLAGGHGGESGGGGSSLAGGVLGMPNGLPELTPLRGGCQGGSASNTGGTGGPSGGAFQLSTAGQLDLTGKVTSPGRGGGGGATAGKGGGGGGSGGGLLLEANGLRISASGKATANGGGGGGGGAQSGGSSTGTAGDDGSNDTATAASGGPAGTSGSGYDGRPGGAGGAGATPAADGGSGSGGGGGGGGAVGRIRFNAASGCIHPSAVISPAATTNGGTFLLDAGC